MEMLRKKIPYTGCRLSARTPWWEEPQAWPVSVETPWTSPTCRTSSPRSPSVFQEPDVPGVFSLKAWSLALIHTPWAATRHVTAFSTSGWPSHTERKLIRSNSLTCKAKNYKLVNFKRQFSVFLKKIKDSVYSSRTRKSSWSNSLKTFKTNSSYVITNFQNKDALGGRRRRRKPLLACLLLLTSW